MLSSSDALIAATGRIHSRLSKADYICKNQTRESATLTVKHGEEK